MSCPAVPQAAISDDTSALTTLRDAVQTVDPVVAAAAGARLTVALGQSSGGPVGDVSALPRTFGMWRPRPASTMFLSSRDSLWSDDARVAGQLWSTKHFGALADSLAGTLLSSSNLFDVFGVGPAAPEPLRVPFQPLSLANVVSWVGSGVVRGIAAGEAEGGQAAEESSMFGTDAGLSGDGSASVAMPVGGASAAVKLKRTMLRPLGAGAEDTVVAYWRFEERPDLADAPATEVPDLTRHSNKGTLIGLDAGQVRYDGCDAPVDHGDPDKIRKPRVLVLGPEHSATDPTPVNTSYAKRLIAGGITGATVVDVAGSWGMTVPVPAWSYIDVGVRPEDPVTSAFTLEMWVKLGVNTATTPEEIAQLAAQLEDAAGDGDGESSGPPPPATVLLSRMEPAGAGLKSQWALVAKDNGALAFMSHVDGSSVQCVESRPGVLAKGAWNHVAVIVDGSSVARRGAGAASRSRGPRRDDDDGDDAASGPCCSIKLYVKGDDVGSGTVPHGAPLPSEVRPPLRLLVRVHLCGHAPCVFAKMMLSRCCVRRRSICKKSRRRMRRQPLRPRTARTPMQAVREALVRS